jgi:hypothetical protein
LPLTGGEKTATSHRPLNHVGGAGWRCKECQEVKPASQLPLVEVYATWRVP